MDDFDPNDRDKGAPPFATYCPYRSPKWRTHSQRGHALNALHNQAAGYSGGVLFTYEGGLWVEVVRFQPHGFLPSRCDGCSSSLLVDETKWDRNTSQRIKTGRRVVKAKQVLQRHNGRLADPLRVLVLCQGCQTGMGY